MKLHKPSVPLQPVVSSCGMSTYSLGTSSFFNSAPSGWLIGSCAKNTNHLVHTMKDVILEDDKILVNYHLKSLLLMELWKNR